MRTQNYKDIASYESGLRDYQRIRQRMTLVEHYAEDSIAGQVSKDILNAIFRFKTDQSSGAVY